MPERSFLVRGLADDTLAGLGLFLLGAHGAQVVGGRNYGEENDQDASESQQALPGAHLAPRAGTARATPQPPGGQHEQHPSEIKKEFHSDDKRTAPGESQIQFFRNGESKSM